MRRGWHEVLMGKEKMHTAFWWENKDEGDHLEGLGINGRVILKNILKEQMNGRSRSLPIWFRAGVESYYKQSNEHSRNFLNACGDISFSRRAMTCEITYLYH